MRRLRATREAWPLRGTFRISRGAKTETVVTLVEIADGDAIGRGESVPYPRYDETPESVLAQIKSVAALIADGLDRAALMNALPPGAARNAVDCALWDLAAKQAGVRAWELAGIPAPAPCETAMTLGLDTPEAMGRAAAAHATLPLLKLKVAGEDDLARVEAVRENAPDARLIVDANEAWTPNLLAPLLSGLAALGVEMVEQPLPAGADAALVGLTPPMPICADESCHTRADLPGLVDRYQMVNVKLDKAGGLTEALALAKAATEAGLGLMIGCMVGTSLAMAPATLLTRGARIVDLDGPLLTARDREPGLVYRGAVLEPPAAALWG